MSAAVSASAAPQIPKAALMNQVRQEAAMTNARQLIEKVNEHCFDKCVPKPGSSLSSGETTCFTTVHGKSTWQHGTPSVNNTLKGYNRKMESREECFKERATSETYGAATIEE